MPNNQNKTGESMEQQFDRELKEYCERHLLPWEDIAKSLVVIKFCKIFVRTELLRQREEIVKVLEELKVKNDGSGFTQGTNHTLTAIIKFLNP